MVKETEYKHQSKVQDCDIQAMEWDSAEEDMTMTGWEGGSDEEGKAVGLDL